ELSLVLLLLLHRTKTRLILGFMSRFLDFAMADGFEASLLFARPLLVLTTALCLRVEAGFFSLARSSFGIEARLEFRLFLALLFVLLLLDAILFEVHQLFEGEENGALFLFGHVGCLSLPVCLEKVPLPRLSRKQKGIRRSSRLLTPAKP